MDRIKIVSDGTAQGTMVFDAKGDQIKNVLAIEILPIIARGIVTAKITFAAEIEVLAELKAP